MILLIGGTHDTGPLAMQLARAGYDVLVSTATDTPLDVGGHPRISRRAGRLDEHAMVTLIREYNIRAIVDASHPYAAQIRALTSQVANALRLPYLTFIRPSTLDAASPVEWADGHVQAAALAFAHNRPVLLTTGANNLLPYAQRSAETHTPLFVRVLPIDDSLAACQRASIDRNHVIAARGPFSVAENRRHLQLTGARVIITKDSGRAGGVTEKLEAAKLDNCHVIVVRRPQIPTEHAFTETHALIAHLQGQLPDNSSQQPRSSPRCQP